MLNLWLIRRRLHIDKIHKNEINFLWFQQGHIYVDVGILEICSKI